MNDPKTSPIHTYRVRGMKCQACVSEIEEALSGVRGLQLFKVSLGNPELVLVFDSPDAKIDAVVRQLPSKFQLLPAQASHPADTQANPLITQIGSPSDSSDSPEDLPEKSLTTYWPLILVVGFILGGTLISMAAAANWNWGFGMRIFMGLFFVIFAFFKLLDLRGFADAYRGYDWVARAIPGYGLIYPLIELGLGCGYLLGVWPLLINWVTLVVMTISIGGVVEAVMRKRTIRCACLGTGFNLPMSQVTIIEDGTMIIMAATMIVALAY